MARHKIQSTPFGGVTDLASLEGISPEDQERVAFNAGLDILAATGLVGSRVARALQGARASALGETITMGLSEGRLAQTIRVFRVEGAANTRLVMTEGGEVIVQGQNTLFLNFGSLARAEDFLAKRLGQGMMDARIKSFEVPKSFLDELRASAVLESEASNFPGRPILVDMTKAPDQFGLRHAQIERLREIIVQGSGTVK